MPRTQLHATAGEAVLATCRFDRHLIAHPFCPGCGCAPFGPGKDPGGAESAAIPVRCLEGIDLVAIPRLPADGRCF